MQSSGWDEIIEEIRIKNDRNGGNSIREIRGKSDRIGDNKIEEISDEKDGNGDNNKHIRFFSVAKCANRRKIDRLIDREIVSETDRQSSIQSACVAVILAGGNTRFSFTI